MSRTVDVLFGREDGRPLSGDAMVRLNSGMEKVSAILRELQFSAEEVRGLSWKYCPEPDVDSRWWYCMSPAMGRSVMSLCFGNYGGSLSLPVQWMTFLQNAQVRRDYRRLVKELVGFFDADTTIFVPDNSLFNNEEGEKLQEGGSFLYTLEAMTHLKVMDMRVDFEWEYDRKSEEPDGFADRLGTE